MKLIKHYCTVCGQYKAVFDVDVYETKTCPECGNVLEPREIEVDPFTNRLEKDVGG